MKRYGLLRDMLDDELLKLPKDAVELRDELVDLEFDAAANRVDHPAGGRRGSKDLADCVAAICWTISRSRALRIEHGAVDAVARSSVTLRGGHDPLEGWTVGSDPLGFGAWTH